jgi:hypothetical protein
MALGGSLFTFTQLSRQLSRPWVLYCLLASGVLAYGWLALRHKRIVSTALSAALVFVLYSSSGVVVYYLLGAISSKSWGAVMLLTLSILVTGGAFTWLAVHRTQKSAR